MTLLDTLTACEVAAVCEPGSQAWQLLRHSGLGGSDAGIISGDNPWRRVSELVLDKAEYRTSEPNADMALGHALEDAIRIRTQDELGITIEDGAALGTLRSLDHPQLLANVDGLALINGKATIIEIKATGQRPWARVPAYYKAQVRHYMAVMGIKRALVCAWHMYEGISKAALLQDLDRGVAPADIVARFGELRIYDEAHDQAWLDSYLPKTQEIWAWIHAERARRLRET